jgi:two-component system LytT family response regulator
MSRLRAILVDDEALARRGLALRLADNPAVEIVAQCANGPEALEAIARLSPDLMFLDIQMPGMSGFDVVCELQAESTPMIVFVTAFDEYAVQAFRVHALDYLLKPIEDQQLQEAVQHALKLHQRRDATLTKEKLMELISGIEGHERSEASLPDADPGDTRPWPSRLTIKDGNDFHFVAVADIQWVDAAGDYMCVHASGKTHIMRITMKQLEASLDPAVFSRVHRSTLVNTHSIAGAQAVDNGEYLLTLVDGRQLKVSRSYAPKIRSLLLD